MANIIPFTDDEGVQSRIFITDMKPYLDARAQADAWAKETGLVLATMPKLAILLKSAMAREAIRKHGVDVDSAHYMGIHDGERVYAVAHGTGAFSCTERLGRDWNNMDDNGLMGLKDAEWRSLLKDAVHLYDIKNGLAPGDGYVAIVRVDKDRPRILPAGHIKLESKDGVYDSIMYDDIALMQCGSEDVRHSIADTFRKEGCLTIGNFHRINEWLFGRPVAGSPVAAGGPLCLLEGKFGLAGNWDRDCLGRFVWVEVPGERSVQYSVPLEARLWGGLKASSHQENRVIQDYFW
jgi:hypothetical protein